MEINTKVFYLVTNPNATSIQVGEGLQHGIITECIQYSSPYSLKGCKVYTHLLNPHRFIPVRLDNVIVNEDLFNKFLETLIKGDTK